MKIKMFPKTAQGYGYRRAQVKGGITLRPEHEEYRRFQERMCKAAQMDCDNHIVVVADGLAIQFDDGEITIATDYVVGSW